MTKALQANGLSQELKEMKYFVEWFMTERCGLQPFFRNPNGSRSEVIFEVCDWRQLYELAAYGGFPIRYPHYTFGLEYYEMTKAHEWGLQNIYEMVINNNPVYAYLQRANSMVDHKLVMAHVYAHAHFFVNNVYFRHTNRKAIDMMANHAVRIRRFQDEYGVNEVEEFLDICLSLENLIDISRLTIQRSDKERASLLDDKSEEQEDGWDGKFDAKRYMNGFINPPKEVAAQRERLEKTKEDEADIHERGIVFPGEPQKDIMLFLAQYAPLKDWQRQMLLIVREEAYYFSPQGQTKILNEGWAAYWHSRAMTELCAAAEIVDYAEHNAGTLAIGRGRINPYALGKTLLLDIEWRWDTHRHGKIYQECDLRDVLDSWDQFVAFKNVFEVCNRNRQVTLRKWQEFLCFWQAVSDRKSELFRVTYDSDRLLRWWHYYLTIDQQLADINKQLNGALALVKKCQNRIERLAGSGNWRKRTELSQQMKFQENYIIRYCRGAINLLEIFARIKVAFRQGKLMPKQFCLPEQFFTYAQKFTGSLPIAMGEKKIFEVCGVHCDLTAIDEYLTAAVCRQAKLFGYDYNENSGYYEITTREVDEVKQKLCAALANRGQPQIQIPVGGGNFENAGELLLEHLYDGPELALDYAEAVMANIYKLWRAPVLLDTKLEEDAVRLIFDKKGFTFNDE
ncbi:MAG: SpoVR family protein [Patescibacteria group bacterium]